MKRKNLAIGLTATFFSLQAAAMFAPGENLLEYRPNTWLTQERSKLLLDFKKLGSHSIDDELAFMIDVLNTYPNAQPGAYDYDRILDSGDSNLQLLSTVCINTAALNVKLEKLHRYETDKVTTTSQQYGVDITLANALFTAAERVCGFAGSLNRIPYQNKPDSP